MGIERDKTKPIFEDFVVDENGEWDLWLLAKGDPCGKIYFRLLKKVDPTPGGTYELGFDMYRQTLIETAGMQRLRLDRPDLAAWFKAEVTTQFPRCESCNEQFKKMGCG